MSPNTKNEYYDRIIQTIPGSIDNPYVNWNANGYRLPTEGEWKKAARYIDGINWTPPYNYASGATSDYTNEEATGLVAWYSFNSGRVIHDVGTKNPNKLGMYDMSGNASELCWDWDSDLPNGTATDYRGPSKGVLGIRIVFGGAYNESPGVTIYGCQPWFGAGNVGFRLARTQ